MRPRTFAIPVSADRRITADLAQDRRRFLGVMALGVLGLAAGCGGQQAASSPDVGFAGRGRSEPHRQPVAGRAGLVAADPQAAAGGRGIGELHGRQGVGAAKEHQADHPDRRRRLRRRHGRRLCRLRAARTGIPLTFNPNGTYQKIWNPHADKLAPLIEKGQVQIGNHTFTHQSIVGRSEAAIRGDIERNEEWINKKFGITSRPYFRPPFGTHNKETDQIVAGIGFTKILLWDGTLGDSKLLTPDKLLYFANEYMTGGRIVLGHANHPTITHMFDKIEDLIKERKLEPVTLDPCSAPAAPLGSSTTGGGLWLCWRLVCGAALGCGGVGGRPRVLLTVRPRTMPMNCSIRSVVSSSSQDSPTSEAGASDTGR